MFSDEKLRGVQIPFYNVDVEQAIAHVAHLEAESSLMVPQAGQCDLAMCYMGRAMGPALPPGAVVLLKAVDPDAIIPGGRICDCQPKNCNFADSSALRRGR